MLRHTSNRPEAKSSTQHHATRRSKRRKRRNHFHPDCMYNATTNCVDQSSALSESRPLDDNLITGDSPKDGTQNSSRSLHTEAIILNSSAVSPRKYPPLKANIGNNFDENCVIAYPKKKGRKNGSSNSINSFGRWNIPTDGSKPQLLDENNQLIRVLWCPFCPGRNPCCQRIRGNWSTKFQYTYPGSPYVDYARSTAPSQFKGVSCFKTIQRHIKNCTSHATLRVHQDYCHFFGQPKRKKNIKGRALKNKN